MKLVVDEAESVALASWTGAPGHDLVSSDLLLTELLRASRIAAPHAVGLARVVLESVTLFSLPTSQFEHAGIVAPDGLRSLDALHLVAALEFGDELDGFLTYDERLADAATQHGLEVIAPR